MSGPFPFDPDYVVAPGETLRDWQEWCDEPESRLKQRLGLDDAKYAQLFDGELPITPPLANKLELATDIPMRFWLNLEHNYRVGLALGKKKL